jgi:predicted nucleotidyltransferase
MNRVEALRAIEIVASALRDLGRESMFVGGVVPAFIVTNPAAPPPRETDDIDVVVDVVTYADYTSVHERLRALGFVEDTGEGAPTCRWVIHGIKVDVMSAGPQPGPQNRWYAEALPHADRIALTNDVGVLIISAPYFIATKLDAFHDRGLGDYAPSSEIEDIVTVVDGRASVEAEVRSSPPSVRAYLAERFTAMLADQDFVDAVAGHLQGDGASQARLPLVLSRMRAIAGAG